MLRLSKHITNVNALQLFQLIRAGALFLISITFTKINPLTKDVILSTPEIGIYESFFIIAGFVSFFWVSGVLQTTLSLYKNNKSFSYTEKNPIFFNVAVLLSLLSILVALLILILEAPIAKLIGSFEGSKIPYMKILFFYIIFSCPGNFIEYIYLLKNKPIRIIIYGVITFNLQVICVIAPIVMGYSLEYGLYGLVFISLIRFIWLIVLVRKYSEIKLSNTFLREFITISTPLTFSILISGSAIYIDSFLVSFKFDKATLAIFRYGAKELPFVSLIPAALGNALTPSFSNPNNLNNALFNLKKETKKIMHIIFPITLIILLSSKYLYPIIFNKSFTESYVIFNVYILLIATKFIFARTILLGKQKMKILFNSAIIELSVNIILSIILINIWGIIGVAIGTFIASIVEKIYLTVYLKIKENIKISQYVDIKTYSLYFVVLVIMFCLSFII